MHQPFTVADEEGVCFINGEVVHGLVGVLDDHDGFNDAVVAVQREDHLARLEVCRVNPHAVVGVEGMLRRG